MSEKNWIVGDAVRWAVGAALAATVCAALLGIAVDNIASVAIMEAERHAGHLREALTVR